MRVICLIVCTCLLFIGNVLAISSGFEDEDSKIGIDVGGIINGTLASIIANISDPLLLANFSETFNNAIITGPVSISNFELSGIHSIAASVLSVDYHALTQSVINITLGIENLNLFFDYEMNILLLQILPLFGKGNISLNLDKIDLEFYSLVTVVLSPLSLKGFKDVSVEFSLGKDTSLSIQGLLDSDDLSEAINKLIAQYGARIIDFLDVNKDRVGKVISAILQSILDGLNTSDYFQDLFANILEQEIDY